MSKVYAAFMPTGARIASGSQTILKKRLSQYPETQWSVFLYDLKPNVETLALLVEGDISKWGTPTPVESFRVNKQGQVRKIDPTKVAA